MMLVRLLLSTLLVVICSNLCLGIVTEPVDDISAIRLSPPKKPNTGRAGQQATRRTMQVAPQQKAAPVKQEVLNTGSKTSHPKVMLNITEPPQGSILLGSTFAVKIDILAPALDRRRVDWADERARLQPPVSGRRRGAGRGARAGRRPSQVPEHRMQARGG